LEKVWSSDNLHREDIIREQKIEIMPVYGWQNFSFTYSTHTNETSLM